MRKIITFLLVLFSGFCLVSCMISQNIPGGLEGAISTAIKSQVSDYVQGETATEGHFILGVVKGKEAITVYTIASCGVFAFENGIFTKISGSGAIPTILQFSPGENEEYSLLTYQEPQNGSGYLTSLKKMFPWQLQKKVKSAGDYYGELLAQQMEQARVYLQKIGREALVQERVEKELPRIDVQVSNKLFVEMAKDDSLLNICPYWLGTREKIENGTRYTYETTQSKIDNNYDLLTFCKKTEDGTVQETRKYKIKGAEFYPLVDIDPGQLRGECFDFCMKNYFSYVPYFEEGQAPVESAEYLFYAFVLNRENWGEELGTMTCSYVEEVIDTHFMVSDIIHSTLPGAWDYDGENYLAVPMGIAPEAIFVLEEQNTFIQDGETVFELLLDKCYWRDIPAEKDLVEIRANIIDHDYSNLTVEATERFKYYLGENGNVVFLSHTVE